MRGYESKLLWIDSSVNTRGDKTIVQVPSHPFSAIGNERMSLTLVSFAMRRGWYNVSPVNNTAYLFVGNAYYEFSITPGVYADFTTLAAGVQNAINTAIATHTIAQLTSVAVTYNAATRLFDLTFAKSQNVPVEVRCFAVKGGATPAGVTALGTFQDVHEILGGKPIRNTEVFNSLQTISNTAAQTVLRSSYPCSLNSQNEIYLHLTGLETGNYMSTGHEVHMQDHLRLAESSLFARIPYEDAFYTDERETIQYEDNGGDMYQSYMTRKTLQTIELRVTDARGRSLANLDKKQADDGLMAFRMCLRWDLHASPSPPVKGHGPKMTIDHLNETVV